MPTVDPTLAISIDCAGMTDPTDVNFYATADTGQLGLTAYSEPAMQARNRYATASDYADGEEILGATWQNTILGWDFVTDLAATENASRLLIARVRLAIARLEYNVTVTVNGAAPEVWRVQGFGSMSPNGERTLANLRNNDPVWAVTLPVYPTRTLI